MIFSNLRFGSLKLSIFLADWRIFLNWKMTEKNKRQKCFLSKTFWKSYFCQKRFQPDLSKKILNEKEISMSDASLFVYTTDVDDIRGLYFKTLRISFFTEDRKNQKKFCTLLKTFPETNEKVPFQFLLNFRKSAKKCFVI